MSRKQSEPVHVLERRQWVPATLEATFSFYSNPRNLGRITPAWMSFSLAGVDAPRNGSGVATNGSSAASQEDKGIRMAAGLRLHYRIRPLLVPQRWTSEITVWQPPHIFVDEQVRGPYRSWRHEHRFIAERSGTVIEDRVEYVLPFGPLGRLAHLLLVERQLKSIFDYRGRAITKLFGGEDA